MFVMPFFDSILVAMFTLAIVFVVLFGLYLCIRLSSMAFIYNDKVHKNAEEK